MDPKRRNQIFWGLAAVGVVTVVAVVLSAVLPGTSSGSSTKNLAKTLAAAGCTFKTSPSQGRTHYTSLTPKNPMKYNSFPPTSGSHYYIAAIWGNYTSPVALIQQIHNLEHGGIVIQYGSKVPQATIDKLNAFYTADAPGLVLAPLPALGGKVALTAWTHLATCSGFDQKGFAAFRDAFRYKGPESPQIPTAAMQPGQ